MSYFNTKKEFSLRDLLYRALIFIGTVGIIVYFLPRDGKFNYQFDIDKPWKYGQLMATFDFPIYKADEVVKREQDSILAAFQPYFQLDKSIEKSVLAKLKADYQTHLRGLLPSTDYVRFLERKLSEVYRAGIVSTEELNQLHKDSTTAIMVINDKLANQQDINKVYSVKDAYNYILTADTAHYRPDILRQCSLNEYLFPNLTYDEQRTETAKKEMLDNYSWANGIVLSGQKIIDRGEIVSQETYNILESLRKESIKRSESIGQKRLMLAGQVLFVSIFMLCFMLYLDLFRKDYYKRKGSLSLTFFLSIIQKLTEGVVLLHDQPFMACVIGASFCGSGIGIAFSNNGSTGGTDIIAAVINKYRDITLGRVMLICDLIIISSSYFVLKDWEKVVYGYVTLYICSFVLDQVVNSARQSVQFFIISDKYEEIAKHIQVYPHRGATVINASGFYTGKEIKMLFVLAKKRESTIIFRLIKDIDPNAFVSQSAVIGVYGEGFDRIKVK